jgi:putative FmdB family regulatory protein
MTRFLTCAFIVMWFILGFIDMSQGDTFHMVTSFTIAVWNASFLRDTIRLEKKVNENKMPKYDYKCQSCGHIEEIEHAMDENQNGAACLNPDNFDCEGSIRKVFSAVPGHFKGQGWGKTYRVHKPKGEK